MKPLIVPASLESLGPIREYIKAAASAADLTGRQSYRLQLAVDEVATNIILHGYEEAGLSGDIELRTEVDAGSLAISLIDAAQPFDPRALNTPADLDSPLEDRNIGGLGVFLAIRNVDEFRYRYADGQNYNVFVVNRTTTESRQ